MSEMAAADETPFVDHAFADTKCGTEDVEPSQVFDRVGDVIFPVPEVSPSFPGTPAALERDQNQDFHGESLSFGTSTAIPMGPPDDSENENSNEITTSKPLDPAQDSLNSIAEVNLQVQVQREAESAWSDDHFPGAAPDATAYGQTSQDSHENTQKLQPPSHSSPNDAMYADAHISNDVSPTDVEEEVSLELHDEPSAVDLQASLPFRPSSSTNASSTFTNVRSLMDADWQEDSNLITGRFFANTALEVDPPISVVPEERSVLSFTERKETETPDNCLGTDTASSGSQGHIVPEENRTESRNLDVAIHNLVAERDKTAIEAEELRRRLKQPQESFQPHSLEQSTAEETSISGSPTITVNKNAKHTVHRESPMTSAEPTLQESTEDKPAFLKENPTQFQGPHPTTETSPPTLPSLTTTTQSTTVTPPSPLNLQTPALPSAPPQTSPQSNKRKRKNNTSNPEVRTKFSKTGVSLRPNDAVPRRFAGMGLFGPSCTRRRKRKSRDVPEAGDV